MLPSSLYIQQLKERLGVNSCNTLTKLFYPSQLTGQYKHPTALSATEWTISNINKFETNRTDWNTSVAAQIYYGDPWSGTAQCLNSTTAASTSAASTTSTAATATSAAAANSVTTSVASTVRYTHIRDACDFPVCIYTDFSTFRLALLLPLLP